MPETFGILFVVLVLSIALNFYFCWRGSYWQKRSGDHKRELDNLRWEKRRRIQVVDAKPVTVTFRFGSSQDCLWGEAEDGRKLVKLIDGHNRVKEIREAKQEIIEELFELGTVIVHPE